MNSNWSYSPETVKLGRDLCDLDLWPLTLTFCMDITFDHGNNSWKFHDDTMMGTWWKRCDRQTDRRTDGRTENTICRAAWSQLKIPVNFQSKYKHFLSRKCIKNVVCKMASILFRLHIVYKACYCIMLLLEHFVIHIIHHSWQTTGEWWDYSPGLQSITTLLCKIISFHTCCI